MTDPGPMDPRPDAPAPDDRLRDWLTPADILALRSPSLPDSMTGLLVFIADQGWKADLKRARPRFGRGGGYEYHVSLLPLPAQEKHVMAGAAPAAPCPRANGLWTAFERLPKGLRDEARRRLDIVERVERLTVTSTRNLAVAQIARHAGVSARTLYAWLALTDGLARADWLPALSPRREGRTATAACSPEAWDYIRTDYIRNGEPAFAASFRRLQDAAGKHGWTIPSARTLLRRLQKEVSRAAMLLGREGGDALKAAYPAQRRTRDHFGPLDAVNIDGHRVDVMVRYADGTLGRPTLIGVQDLGTGLMVGWWLGPEETAWAVRMAIAAVIRSHGVPGAIYMDNGRAFAAKDITGGTANRYRFKVRADDPQGLLTTLGVAIHWTSPYSGQSKPIERAWRDLVEEVSRHPACQGAYTGSNPTAKPADYGTRAVAFDDLKRLVDNEIARHNTRPGRRGLGMNGRSFAQVWADKIAAGAIVRQASDAQKRLLLLASERVTTHRTSGMIAFAGNRYWTERLGDHAGKPVFLRFDPDDLKADIAVYDLEDRLICLAPCIEDVGFDSREDAQSHARLRRQFQASTRRTLELERRLTTEEAARLLPAASAPEPPAPKVTRLVANGRPVRTDAADHGLDAFAKGVAALEAGAVLPFRRNGEEGP
jgi:hypothetical protein